MALNVCKKLCKECPFSNQSIPGWLASYDVEDFKTMQDNDILFPCHMMMPDEDIPVDQLQDRIMSGELKLCRGYIESYIKSCKMPRSNKLLIQIRAEVKAEGLSEESMSLHQFNKYHTSLTT